MATLYRNFPSRQELLEALFTGEVNAVCEAAETVEGETPGAALTSAGTWVAGPQMLSGTNGLGGVDAPGAEMITGNVLLCIGPTNGFNAPCYF